MDVGSLKALEFVAIIGLVYWFLRGQQQAVKPADEQSSDAERSGSAADKPPAGGSGAR